MLCFSQQCIGYLGLPFSVHRVLPWPGLLGLPGLCLAMLGVISDRSNSKPLAKVACTLVAPRAISLPLPSFYIFKEVFILEPHKIKPQYFIGFVINISIRRNLSQISIYKEDVSIYWGQGILTCLHICSRLSPKVSVVLIYLHYQIWNLKKVENELALHSLYPQF